MPPCCDGGTDEELGRPPPVTDAGARHHERIARQVECGAIHVLRDTSGVDEAPLALNSRRVHREPGEEGVADRIGHGDVVIGSLEVFPSEWAEVELEAHVEFVEVAEDRSLW